MRAYQDLIVWQKSMFLVKEVYALIRLLPSEERFALADQMRRSVISIPSNIAEGYGRNTTKEYVRFLSIARGSEYEVETQIQICIMLKYVTEEQARNVFCLCNEVSRMLSSIIQKLVPNPNP